MGTLGRMRRIVPIALGIVLLGSPFRPAAGEAGQAAAQAESGPADLAVLDLLQEDLDALRRADPVGASTRGDRRFDSLLYDPSPEAIAAASRASRDRLQRAGRIDPAACSPMRRTELAMLTEALQLRLDGERFREWEMAISQISGPQYDLPQMPQSVTFTTERHLQDYAARLEAVPRLLEVTTTNLRAGLDRGFTPPKVVMGNAAEQAFAHGAASVIGVAGPDPARHALFAPFAGRPGPLAERAKKALLEGIVPAYDRFGRFLRDEYIPGCRVTLGASQLPNGVDYYNHRIRVESTLDLTAEEIHQIGLREVARIRAEMMDVIARTGFETPPGETAAERFGRFIAHLRSDPKFYCTTPGQLLTAYRDAGKRIDAELPRLFIRMPVLPWGVREMPRFIAPSSPTAYYYPGSLENGQAGFFVANTHLLDQRPLYDVIPLTLHEAVPGHHFQVSMSQELKDVPEWRTSTGYTGFVEGWALYAERLGLEMGEDAQSPANPAGRGLFTEPYDDFGRLNFEMWRALRLVVDTGIHSKGWTRERAIELMQSNSALSHANIEREVDRYIAWPGQAVAYKLGEMHILGLRARAERELGNRFDIREFHAAMLGRGAVPLGVLTAQIEEWIASRRAD